VTLSESDRRSLTRIAALIEAKDPDFAAEMTGPHIGNRSSLDAAIGDESSFGWGRIIALCLMAAVFAVALALVILGVTGRGEGTVITGGSLLGLDLVGACWMWLRRRRRRGRADAP
jgi:hypothetical protein